MGSTLTIDMRPRDFSEVIGLEEQIKAIRSKLDTGDVPRAILLHGPFGTGKTTLAYIIARAVQGWDFPAEAEPQVQEVNAANVTGVDDMRKLCDSAQTRPMFGKYGVIILDEAHKLSKPAQECLLKEFESESPTTVWIICTTNPEKLIDGIKAGRCFTLRTRGMDEEKRAELVARAAKELEHTADYSDFLAALTKSRLSSPRKILMAFEAYHHGLGAVESIASQGFEDLPELHDIAFGVVFGNWEKDIADWRDRTKIIKAVGAQFQKLEEDMNRSKAKRDKKSNPAPESAEGDVPFIEPEEIMGKTEAAHAVRAIVGAFLKNRVYKGGPKAQAAAEVLDVLAKAIPAGAFEVEWSCTVGLMYRINKKLQGVK